jgi:hypothetical protein
MVCPIPKLTMRVRFVPVARNGHGSVFGRASARCWVFGESTWAIYDSVAAHLGGM